MADTKDFERVAMPHLDSVYRAAVALCPRHEHAEDLVQTTFLKAFQRFGSFRPGTNCRAWLLTILRNSWIDHLRHRKVAGPTVPVDEGLVAEAPRAEPTEWTNAGDVLESFSDEQVIRALRELPDEQRLALFLVDVEEMSHEEVAEITGVAVGTVKSRTSRARSKLKARLMAHARDLGLTGRVER